MTKHLEYQFTLGDKSWTVDFASLTVDEYIDLKRVTGYGVARMAIETDRSCPLAYKALVWMARRRSGEDIAFDAPEMSFVMAELRAKVVRDDFAAEAAEAAKAGAKPGPTRAPRAPRTRTAKTTSKTR